MPTMNLVLVFMLLFLFGRFCMSDAIVVLIGNNITLSFDDVEANFAPAVRGSGDCGVLYLAEPIDACSTLTNVAAPGTNYSSPFVLIIRGGCSFEEKVRRAQKAGYKAAIVYDNEEGGGLVSSEIVTAGIMDPVFSLKHNFTFRFNYELANIGFKGNLIATTALPIVSQSFIFLSFPFGRDS